jgi:fumarate reductase subunit D
VSAPRAGGAPRRRSRAPIFWLMFGAGGMLSALLGSALVLVTGLVAPFGAPPPGGILSYARVLAFAQNPIGKLAIFVVVALFAWHAAHRLFHSIHDVGWRAGAIAKLLCYGTALVLTVVLAGALWRVGF